MTTTIEPAPAGLPEYLVENRLPPELQELERRGRLAEVESRLQARFPGKPPAAETSPDAPAAGDEQLAWRELDRLRRLRREFPLTLPEFLEQLRRQLPDATLDELERWATEGKLQCVTIDGELRVFRREPVNLFRFAEEAMKRRTLPRNSMATGSAGGKQCDRSAACFCLDEHVRSLVAAWRQDRCATPHGVRIRATHRLVLKPDRVPAGSIVRCWIPLPRAAGVQSAPTIIQSDPPGLRISAPAAPQRTVYFEQPAAAGAPMVFSLTWEYRTSAYLPLLSGVTSAVSPPQEELRRDLAEEVPHIVFTPEIRELARDIAGAQALPLERARSLFAWVVDNVRYASEMEYAVMPRIVEKALATRRGDCGVQALLFITLCRAAGVPARWVSGWVVYPSGWNMHDWAEFYVEPYGWLPADLSRGWRDDADPDVRHFYFGNTDAYRMIANVAARAPFDPLKRFWRSDPVDNQRGELEWEGGNLYYDDWSYEVAVSSERLD
jgi:transglutaminase-like putative cysteine protease